MDGNTENKEPDNGEEAKIDQSKDAIGADVDFSSNSSNSK
jgi:hypothetical protein